MQFEDVQDTLGSMDSGTIIDCYVYSDTEEDITDADTVDNMVIVTMIELL